MILQEANHPRLGQGIGIKLALLVSVTVFQLGGGSIHKAKAIDWRVEREKGRERNVT